MPKVTCLMHSVIPTILLTVKYHMLRLYSIQYFISHRLSPLHLETTPGCVWGNGCLERLSNVPKALYYKRQCWQLNPGVCLCSLFTLSCSDHKPQRAFLYEGRDLQLCSGQSNRTKRDQAGRPRVSIKEVSL